MPRKNFKTTTYCTTAQKWDDVGGIMSRTGRMYTIGRNYPKRQPDVLYYNSRRGYGKRKALRDLEKARKKSWSSVLKEKPKMPCPRRGASW